MGHHLHFKWDNDSSSWGLSQAFPHLAKCQWHAAGKAAIKKCSWDFPGGAVVKNPPANAGDTGSSPGPGRSHMPRSNEAREPQLLSPRATTTEAPAPRAHAPQQEKPPQWEAHALKRRVALARRNQGKPTRSNEDPTQP